MIYNSSDKNKKDYPYDMDDKSSGYYEKLSRDWKRRTKARKQYLKKKFKKVSYVWDYVEELQKILNKYRGTK